MFYDPTVPENQMGRVYKHMVWSLKGSKTADKLGASVIPQTIQKLRDKEPDKSKHPKSWNLAVGYIRPWVEKLIAPNQY